MICPYYEPECESIDCEECDYYAEYAQLLKEEEKTMDSEFKVGEYIIYVNGDRYEIGRIKRLCENNSGAFVCYHEGDTAAKTPFNCMHKLVNGYCITDTTLGGTTFKEHRLGFKEV